MAFPLRGSLSPGGSAPLLRVLLGVRWRVSAELLAEGTSSAAEAAQTASGVASLPPLERGPSPEASRLPGGRTRVHARLQPFWAPARREEAASVAPRYSPTCPVDCQGPGCRVRGAAQEIGGWWWWFARRCCLRSFITEAPLALRRPQPSRCQHFSPGLGPIAAEGGYHFSPSQIKALMDVLIIMHLPINFALKVVYDYLVVTGVFVSRLVKEAECYF